MANNKKSNDFIPIENDIDISQQDFRFIDNESRSHEQKFVTKPTTFIKDSFKRFCKNKSSVVAGIILGGLLILSFLIPVVDTSDVVSSHTELTYLEPKLFNSGTGFWDGTKAWESIPVDTSAYPNADSEELKQEHWWPNPSRFEKNGVSNKVFSDVIYTSSISEFGRKGYVRAGYYGDDKREYTSFKTFSSKADIIFDFSQEFYLDILDTFDINKIGVEEGEENKAFPEEYTLGECALFFEYYDENLNLGSVQLTEYKSVHNIGTQTTGYTPEEKVDISSKIVSATGKTFFSKINFNLRIKNLNNGVNTCILVKSIKFSTTSKDSKVIDLLNSFSFIDATKCLNQPINDDINGGYNYKFWSCNGTKGAFMSQSIYCSFIYDSYEAKLGTKMYTNFPKTKLEQYQDNGWIRYTIHTKIVNDKYYLDESDFEFVILDAEKCPIAEPLQPTPNNVNVIPDTGDITINCKVVYYKFYGYSSMPRFLFGTDKTGRDMLKYVFEGLRTSLLLGLLTFAICFTFGLIYGAVSGYYGGTVDLILERFTDILSGVPWIVVMTLAIIKLGSNFWTFALALCLTGWIGTAATTRTQFYRFRGREYVLASRTLGASNARLIAKHILPNAMGTIITGAVLMIPSIIFSEATISYLGLGLKNMSSLGVILSNNQNELTSNPYLLIFPAVVIALLMICFNLFGNGLRDAINPSLKGEEQ